MPTRANGEHQDEQRRSNSHYDLAWTNPVSMSTIHETSNQGFLMARENSIVVTPKIIARFFAKVNKNGPVPIHCPEIGPCWVWTASLGEGGYGQFGVSRISPSLKAHRVSWVINVGHIPDHLWVLHKCDNPSCVNPGHLFIGDRCANMKDAANKGRIGSQVSPWKHQGELHPRATVTEQDVRDIRRRYEAGESYSSIGKNYAMKKHGLQDIIYRRSWSHVDPHIKFIKRKRGPRSNRATLTDDQVREARRRCAAGESQVDVANSLGTTRHSIHLIVSGKTYAYVE